MVHALEEVRRVLTPAGTLLDLRPLADSWPVEILEDGNPLETGRLTDLPTGLDDDQAANLAVEEAARRGWFKREGEQTFPLYVYWDNPEEMTDYINERWADFVEMGVGVQQTTRITWADAGDSRRVRMKLKMLLTSWQKQ
jgi:hypothetical protein